MSEHIKRLNEEYLRSHSGCLLGAKIIKRGRANATVETTVRFSPSGPWFTQRHKIPLSAIVETVELGSPAPEQPKKPA